MRLFALIFAVLPGVLAAEEFQTLTGAEILDALSGHRLEYNNGASQTFDASMYTQYFSGGPSSGQWAVRDDQYCSVWPPSDLWACYTVERQGDVIRFVGSGGDITEGVYSK